MKIPTKLSSQVLHGKQQIQRWIAFSVAQEISFRLLFQKRSGLSYFGLEVVNKMQAQKFGLAALTKRGDFLYFRACFNQIAYQ